MDVKTKLAEINVGREKGEREGGDREDIYQHRGKEEIKSPQTAIEHFL